MSSIKVFDSYAIIAMLEEEPGGEKVTNIIKESSDNGNRLLLSIINLGEVYYITRRSVGKLHADAVIHKIDTLPIEVIPADRRLTLLAAELKSSKKMSYADCFAAALAKMYGADLVTGDRSTVAGHRRRHQAGDRRLFRDDGRVR